jgi:outer membrane protein assembly factor BamB
MSRLFSLGVTALSFLAVAAITLAAPAPEPSSTADWPQFRGPKRDDVSPDKGLLKSWPAEGPKLLWKGPGVGQGFSSVSVVGNKVFTMGDKDGASHLFALSRETGKVLWSHKVGQPGGNYSGTRCTPTVDGDLVYGIGQFGDLVCLEAATGNEKWRKNFRKDFEGSSGGWNYTESPLIDGDRLVCTPGGAKATMVVLNKKDGEEIWRAPLRQTAGYSSIVISNGGGVKQYVQLTAAGTIGVAAKDGKLLWHYEKYARNTANIPTPIVVGDQIFTAAGYERGGALLTLSADSNGVKFTEKYHKSDLANKHGGVLIVGDYVYGDTDDRGNPYCAEWKTGAIKWTRRAAKGNKGKGGGSASLTCADGMLYIRYSNGWVSLVPASPDGYTEKGTFKVPNGTNNCWAHPVVIGGRMYLREKDIVWCYDVKAK